MVWIACNAVLQYNEEINACDFCETPAPVCGVACGNREKYASKNASAYKNHLQFSSVLHMADPRTS